MSLCAKKLHRIVVLFRRLILVGIHNLELDIIRNGRLGNHNSNIETSTLVDHDLIQQTTIKIRVSVNVRRGT